MTRSSGAWGAALAPDLPCGTAQSIQARHVKLKQTAQPCNLPPKKKGSMQ